MISLHSDSFTTSYSLQERFTNLSYLFRHHGSMSYEIEIAWPFMGPIEAFHMEIQRLINGERPVVSYVAVNYENDTCFGNRLVMG